MFIDVSTHRDEVSHFIQTNEKLIRYVKAILPVDDKTITKVYRMRKVYVHVYIAVCWASYNGYINMVHESLHYSIPSTIAELALAFAAENGHLSVAAIWKLRGVNNKYALRCAEIRKQYHIIKLLQ